MKYKVTLNGKTYEVEVTEKTAEVVSVSDAPAAPAQAAAPAPAAPAAPAQAAAPAPAAPAAPAAPVAAAPTAEGETLPAPMPGTIVKVLAPAGTAVKEGDVLFILEAMKMENEIVSPKTGTVAQVLVSEGASVSSGQPLCVIA
ncbi:MAG: biotin/lipoyl-binding protein [Clostridiales bacterium]|nr:biotin/lipoyl-binding protein [Clostridiales bacterium]HOL80072.1 acetyl-CoA carboxylase biotin carboxyl carrier protein subunit [Clostridiales bacterium]